MNNGLNLTTDESCLIETTPTFNKELRSLKYYCARSYKDLIFNIGNSRIRKSKNGINRLDIFTDNVFKAIYGQIRLVFEKKEKCIYLQGIEPENLLLNGHIKLLEIYNGIPIMSEKDKFKVKLLKKMEEKND